MAATVGVGTMGDPRSPVLHGAFLATAPAEHLQSLVHLASPICPLMCELWGTKMYRKILPPLPGAHSLTVHRQIITNGCEKYRGRNGGIMGAERMQMRTRNPSWSLKRAPRGVTFELTLAG